MAVSSELHFSPEITPHRISKRVNPPNLGEEFTALFKEDGLVDRSFQPLLTVFERIAQEGISIAPIEVDPNYYLFDPVEFLIAPLKSVEGGGRFKAAKIVLRTGETLSFGVEESLPTRRLRETGGQIDSLRPTLEIYLVDATIQENGTVTYELNEAPTVKIYRENHPIKDPAHFSKYLYTVNTTDTHGSTNAIIDETASEKSAEIGGHLGLLISSITHALYRHGELIKALESGDIDQFNETYEERLARENDQIGALLRAYMSGFTSETALVPLVSVPTAISRLSPREQDAIRIFYGSGQEGKKLKDLAAELGVSPTRARELVQRALAKLKFSLLPHNNE